MAKTLKDIAEKLNLSISTVSCALKDGPKVVSPAVRKRVRKTALEMGYRPNRIARSLATGRTRTVGVVPMYVDEDTLLHPYLQLALNGIFNAANKLKQDVLVYTAQDHNRPETVTDDLLDSRSDGVIFISPRADSLAIKSVAESGLPYAVLFETSGGQSFTVDSRAGVFLALEHLVELGHRRIAHITGDLTLSDGRLRRDAFLEFMEEHRLPVPAETLIEGNFTRESGYLAGAVFLKLCPMPTAVFCSNDDIALGLMDALTRSGVRCPEDVSIVGFDGVLPPGSSVPPLTTMRQPAQLMAAEALRSVVKNIEAGIEIESRVFQPEFIVRGSTASIPLEGIV